MNNDTVYSTYEISKMLNVDISSVTNWINSGKLRAYKTPGGHRRVNKIDFMQFVEEYNMPVNLDKDKKTRILIVDDEIKVRNSIIKVIEKTYPEIEIFEADNGFTAGKILAAESIDLLTLDIRMPGIDGYEVMRQIRDDRRLGNPEIIVITGYPEKGIEQKIGEYGVKNIIIKPFEVDELRDAIKKIITV